MKIGTHYLSSVFAGAFQFAETFKSGTISESKVGFDGGFRKGGWTGE